MKLNLPFVRRSKLAEAQQEIDRLMGLIASPESMELLADERGIELVAQYPHWACKLMAGSFAETLAEATNWMCVVIGPVPGPDCSMVVTIRRLSGETPEETVGKLRAEIEELKARLTCS
jgi:hypothetical protein